MNLDMLQTLIERSREHCTEKETDFMQSVYQQFEKKGYFTHGQQQWLESLTDKYSQQNIRESEEWLQNWSDTHRAIALKIAHYYAENPPYFAKTVERVLMDPENYILSKKEWDKFCENKYAKRIRAEYDSDVKFKKGDCVQIRRTNKLAYANYTGTNWNPAIAFEPDKVGFVMKINAKPITRAAKGSRIYQILLAGHATPIYAHESDLKKKRGLKR